MEINIKDLLEKKAMAEAVIKREELNITLYNQFILDKINKNLEYTRFLNISIDTVEEFSEYTKEYNLTNIVQTHDYKNRDVTYAFTYKNNAYKIVIPLRYLDIEDLTPYLLMNYNYCKVKLYNTKESFVHRMIDCFADVKTALNFLKDEMSKEELV